MAKVSLVIKNPGNQSIDFRTEIELSKTVGDLKQLIAQQYPNNPAPQAQRLIFSGKLLEDSNVLTDLLKQHDTSFPQTFHLVVKTQPAQPPQPAPTPVNAGMPPFGMPDQPFRVPPFHPQQMPHFQHFGNFYPPGVAPPHIPHQPVPPPVVVRPAGGNDVGLLVKLAVLVLILSQGGSTQRTIILSVGCLIAYLYQTGRLRVVVFRGIGQPHQRAPDGIADATAPVQPRTGLWGEVVDLVVPFVCSLVPTWSPKPVAEAPPQPDDQDPAGEEPAFAH